MYHDYEITLSFSEKRIFEINTSIVRHSGFLWAVFRSQHLFTSYDSESYLAQLDDNFNTLQIKRLISTNGNPAFEDVRLISINDKLIAVYTYLPKIDDKKWLWEFGVGIGLVDIESGTIQQQASLRNHSRRLHEKNWVPYIWDNTLYILTDYDPFLRILKVEFDEFDFKIAECFFSHNRTKKWIYGEIRGGTPLIRPCNNSDGWLYGFVHSYLNNFRNYERYYFYTVIRFHPETNSLQYSKIPLGHAGKEVQPELYHKWKVSTNGKLKVIFPMGIINYENGVIVSLGVDDVISKLRFYKWAELFNLFE